MAKKKINKIEVDRSISKLTKDLVKTKKTYRSDGPVFTIFDNIPEEIKIDGDLEKGRRVLTSHYPETHDVYFVEYYKSGEKSFPFGGVKVYNKSLEEYKLLYPEAVVKHKNVEFFTRIFD